MGRKNEDKKIEYTCKVGYVLSTLRAEQGLSQNEMSRRLNITIPAYMHYEHGEFLPNIFTLSLIAKAFGMTTPKLVNMIENTEL